ncbi:RagB/SusD family nutrient uptake outer membrane protein [Chryseobacterium turcicum]|uniref:RagB/SusD family nutrient uptake outer membrane protein n=1 Tax=Chryseobacterium turcicum TaxID=2898076 RepID=A0A9Q3YXB1_9FLAO|nr:RagB/SusD family nutrient uptake outer membrane protein [Chryseobacterium turcicum]MCD1118963.1 RagB/SusD family nutrient uptake outer membrane protein [Chryseobacterium turcicum]
MKKYIIKAAFAIIGAFTIVSCSDDFLETEFSNTEEQAPITTVEKLQAFTYGNYATMRDFNYYGNYFITTSEVRSDEMYSNTRSGYHNAIMNYTMLSTNAQSTGAWTAMYTAIAKSNIIINTADNLSWAQSANPAVVSQKVKHLKGQAYALRAQAFFDLLRLFGQKYTQNPAQLGVVLPVKYNPSANMARSSIAQTEAQIEADFAKAFEYLDGNSNNSYGDKTVLNDHSVEALMSRYYLYKGNYPKVRSLVNNIVASGIWSVVKGESFVSSFTLNNSASNSMFELAVGSAVTIAPSLNDFYNGEGAYKNVVVKTATYNSYVAQDVRRNAIGASSGVAGRFLNGKYPALASDNNIRMVRYEEVLLNGIEAELNGGSAATALGYYQAIHAERVKIVPYVAPTVVDINILKAERSRELLGEGFRMWDLLRWGTNLPKNISNGGTNGTVNLGNNLLAFPIPQSETNVAGTAIVSNPGYDN